MRTDAWSSLGRPVHADTAQGALEQGLLAGWDVRRSPAGAFIDGVFVPVEGRFAVLRNDPADPTTVAPLGVVGSSHRILQNEDSAGLLDAIVEESGAEYHTAGDLGEGRKVFVSMKLPGSTRVGGEVVENYLTMVNSHDGSMALTFLVTPVHVGRGALLNFAIGDSKGIFRNRHTSGVHSVVERVARDVVDSSFDYLDEHQSVAEFLASTPMSMLQFEKFLVEKYGAPEGSAQGLDTKRSRMIEQVAKCWGDAIDGTYWTALLSLCEWYDHTAPTRGDTLGTMTATNAIFYPGFKTDALASLLRKAVK